MIVPVTRKFKIEEVDDDKEAIEFWLKKSSDERMEAMGVLHKQMLLIQGYKEIPRIKKVTKKVDNIK